jgi:hypothetical protein
MTIGPVKTTMKMRRRISRKERKNFDDDDYDDGGAVRDGDNYDGDE